MPVDQLERHARRLKAWELHILEGKGIREVGQILGITHPTVLEDCRMVDAEMAEALKDRADEWRAKHVRMKMVAASECWKAWKESHHRIEKLEKARSVKDKDGDTVTQELIRQEKLGSVQFLSEMRAQLESIERIVPGMIAPTTHELTGKGGNPLFPLDKFDELFERDDFNDILSGRTPFLSIAAPGGNGSDGNGHDGNGSATPGAIIDADAEAEPVDPGDAGGNGEPGPLDAGTTPGDH